MFDLDAISYPLALKIIRAHPLGYIKRLAREYVDIFNPTIMLEDPWDTFDGDPVKTYQYWRRNIGPRLLDFQFFRRLGMPNGKSSNKAISSLFKTIYDNPIVANFRTWYFASELILSHLIFLAAIACYLFGHAQANLRKLSVVLIMLFLSAALPDLSVAACQVDKSRYALFGEMELHLLFILALFSVAGWFISMARKWPPQKQTNR